MPTSAGIHYFLHEGGKPARPPVVLIHGAGMDHLSWPPEIRRLLGARLLTLDLPGHGNSPGPGRQTVEDYASSVISFVDAVGLSRAVFVGLDLGGAIGLALAIHHPGRVAGIGLISSGARLPIPSALMENAANQATSPLAIRSLVDLMNIPQSDSELIPKVISRLGSIRPTLLHADLCACDLFDASSQLDQVDTSVLVLCGTRDQLTPPRYSQSLAGQIPGAALQTIEGAGHLLPLEQPRRVAGLLSVFLASIAYTPGR